MVSDGGRPRLQVAHSTGNKRVKVPKVLLKLLKLKYIFDGINNNIINIINISGPVIYM